MKTNSAVLSVVLTLLIAGSASAQSEPKHRMPRADANLNPAANEALAARVKSEACSFAGSVSCGSSRSSTTQSCADGEYYADFWQFPAVAGQQFSVTVTESAPYDVLITIHRPSDSEIVAQRVGSGSITVSYTPSTSGTHGIAVGFVAKYYRGAYNMSVACGNTGGGGECQFSAHLYRGVPLTTDVGNSTACSSEGSTRVSKSFSFDAEAGEPVEIAINGSVGIWSEAWAEFESDWTYSGSMIKTAGTLKYVYYPLVSGTQVLWVTPYDSSVRFGSYTVQIDDVDLGPCRRRAVRH